MVQITIVLQNKYIELINGIGISKKKVWVLLRPFLNRFFYSSDDYTQTGY